MIGLEVLEREESLSDRNLSVQVSAMSRARRELSHMGAEPVLSVHAPYVPIEKFDLASDSSETRRSTVQAVTRCAKLAESIGARVVNTHLGGIVRTRSNASFKDPSAKEVLLGRVKDSLVDIIGGIEQHDVTLAMENVPYPLEETPKYSPVVGIFPRDFSEILKTIGSMNIAVTVDFCHLWITHKTMKEFSTIVDSHRAGGRVNAASYHGLTCYEADSIKALAVNPFEAFIKPLRERIIHIHVADSIGTYVPGTSRVSEGEPLGEGDLDLCAFADSLRQIESCSPNGKSIMIVLEPKEADFAKPLNALRSLLRLDNLIKTEIYQKKG